MRQVNSTDFKTHFGEFVDLVREEPIEVLRGNKPVGVFVSSVEYAHLKQLEDAYWVARLRRRRPAGNGLATRRPCALTDKLKRDV